MTEEEVLIRALGWMRRRLIDRRWWTRGDLARDYEDRIVSVFDESVAKLDLCGAMMRCSHKISTNPLTPSQLFGKLRSTFLHQLTILETHGIPSLTAPMKYKCLHVFNDVASHDEIIHLINLAQEAVRAKSIGR